MANPTRSSSAGRGGDRLSAPPLFARFAILVTLTLQLNACSAEPALPAGPEWKSGELRRSDDGRVQLVPARRPEAAPAAAASTPVRTKPKARQGRQAMVSWAAPKTYVDGTPIRNPLTYKVYYQELIGGDLRFVPAGPNTRVEIKGLAPGKTYRFFVVAHVMGHPPSSPSKAVEKRIPP